MRVLQIPRRFVRDDWGGTETVIFETCQRLLQRGWDTSVCCPNALAESNFDSLDGLNVRRFPYFYPYLGLSAEASHRLDKKAGNLFSWSLLRHLQQEPLVDVMHVHSGKRLGGIVRHVARQRGIPYVVSLHGGVLDVPAEEASSWTEPTRGTLEWGKALGWWVGSRRVLDDAAAILCVGGGEYRAMSAQFPQKRVIQLPNGADVERFAQGDGASFRRKHGIPHAAKVMLCVARIDPQKNQIALVDTLQQCLQVEPNTHLVLIGHVTNHQYAWNVQDRISTQELASNVTIIPGVDPLSSDLQDAYQAADVFVLPSVHEPFGIVVLEAWAAGLPVVANSVGGLMDLIDHEVDGLLCSPTSPESFTSAVRELLTCPAEHRMRLGDRGQEKACREYSWDAVTEKLIDIYAEVTDHAIAC